MKRFALLVAGGHGSRMGADLPKQFLLLAGKPVLLHTLEKFASVCDGIVVVMHSDYLAHWSDLCKEHQCRIPHQVVAGGSTRAQSVKNGLAQIPAEALVAIHDAVRPLLSQDLIERLFKHAEKEGNAVPVIPVKDSLRMVEGDESKAVNRAEFRAVQTPQVFVAAALMKAFIQPGFEDFTDEASLYEAMGNRVELVAGEEQNIKLTVPADLLFAEALLKP